MKTMFILILASSHQQWWEDRTKVEKEIIIYFDQLTAVTEISGAKMIVENCVGS